MTGRGPPRRTSHPFQGHRPIDAPGLPFRLPGLLTLVVARHHIEPVNIMKVRNSLKSLRGRHRDNRVVRRKGRVYVINKTNRRFKARQG